VLYSIRKNIGKWKIVLWPVVISIAASSLTMLTRSSQVGVAARVNGQPITYRTFLARKRRCDEQVASIRNEARSRGIPADFYLQLRGLSDPLKATLDSLVYDQVVFDALEPLWIKLNDDVVSEALLEQLPPEFLDKDGSVDMAVYRRYMQMMQTRVAEFEHEQEEVLLKKLFTDFVAQAAYLSLGQVRERVEQDLLKKSFVVAKITVDAIKKDFAKQDIAAAELESFYESNKERYRVAEKRVLEYWVVSAEKAGKKVDISAEALRQHYEKNKDTLYRVSPRVKVRHILLSADTDDARVRADEIHAQIAADPSVFADLARQYSADKDTAEVGGVRDFFAKGTYDAAFEKAAFRLQHHHELAPVVKTDKGFEIIQLVERIPAAVKPFEDVKDEIEATLRAKKAIDWTRMQLDLVKRGGSDEEAALKDIAAAADTHKTIDDAEETRGNAYSLEGQVIQQGFTINEITGCATCTHDGASVLIRLKEKKPSFVRPYVDVEKTVFSDVCQEKAINKVRSIAREVCAQVRSEGVSLQSACKDIDASVETTDYLGYNDGSKGAFKSAHGLLKKAFALTNQSQVVLQFVGNDAYLVSLVGIDPKSQEDADRSLESAATVVGDTVDQEASLLSQALVSSLLRNARVEFDEKILNTVPREEPLPYDL